VGDAGKNKKSGRKQNRTCAGAGDAQLAGSGWDSASRGEGSRSNRRFGRRDAAPPLCLSLVSPSLGLDQGVAVATEKGKRSWRLEQPPKRVGWFLPARPDPTHEATRGVGVRVRVRDCAARPTGAGDDGRRRLTGGSPAAGGASWRRAMDAASGGGAVGMAPRRGVWCGPLQQTG